MTPREALAKLIEGLRAGEAESWVIFGGSSVALLVCAVFLVWSLA